MDFIRKNNILITCSLKNVPYLKQELAEHSFQIQNEGPASVETEGTLNDCIKLNIYLRTAHRVAYLISNFQAASPDELYEQLKRKIVWNEILEVKSYFSVSSYADHPSINNTMFVNQRCKDAVADYFFERYKSRPSSGSEKDKTVIYVYWKENRVSVYLDTSGESLSKHGYRKNSHLAPLQESLAASIILASRWDKKSHFINPMCGSGTLAIEAALIASNKANGLLRNNFSFMHIKGYDEKIFFNEINKAKEKIIRSIPLRIIATDSNPMAVTAARQNAISAGVHDLVEFKVCDFSETEIPSGSGVVMFNPPYGKRIGEEAELEKVYKGIGDFFKQKCKGYTGYIFTANAALAKKVGLRTKRKIEFYNAKDECRLLEYELYEGTKKVKDASAG